MEAIVLLANELQGHIELNSGKEALHLARRVLASKRITVEGSIASLDALTLFANHLSRWKRRMESAYSRLNPADARQARSKMFDFYVAFNHWDDAERLMPAKPTTAHQLMFKVWTLLELRRIKEAIRLFVKRWRLKTAIDEACLAEAVASCLAQGRSWRMPNRCGDVGVCSVFWPTTLGPASFSCMLCVGCSPPMRFLI